MCSKYRIIPWKWPPSSAPKLEKTCWFAHKVIQDGVMLEIRNPRLLSAKLWPELDPRDALLAYN